MSQEGGGIQMIMNCDICGEDKLCKEYICKIGERKDFMFLCNDCIQIQQKVGEVKEFGEVKEADK
jgi:hypothetical protein